MYAYSIVESSMRGRGDWLQRESKHGTWHGGIEELMTWHKHRDTESPRTKIARAQPHSASPRCASSRLLAWQSSGRSAPARSAAWPVVLQSKRIGVQRPGPDARIQQHNGRSVLVPSPASYAQVLRLQDQGLGDEVGVTKTSDSKHLHGWAAGGPPQERNFAAGAGITPVGSRQSGSGISSRVPRQNHDRTDSRIARVGPTRPSHRSQSRRLVA